MTQTLLCVEDNASQQYVIRQLCERFDYKVQCVSSGAAAIEVLTRSNNYAAVLLDINMPEMDGFQCARRIREIDRVKGRHTPIIAVTARAGEEDRRACLAAGMDDYISKPLDVEHFRQILLRHTYVETKPNLKLLRDYRHMHDLQTGTGPDLGAASV